MANTNVAPPPQATGPCHSKPMRIIAMISLASPNKPSNPSHAHYMVNHQTQVSHLLKSMAIT